MRTAGVVVVALFASAAGCASSSGTVDAGATSDVVIARDASDAAPDVPPDVPPDTGTSVMRNCQDVRECAGLPTPTGARFGAGWNCVVGTCTWAPVSGRTCYEYPSGCHQCRIGGDEVCPGAACAGPVDPATARIESANCARGFLQDIDRCEGEFVRLNDGTYCLLSEAPTNAIRFVLSCGTCEVVFTPQ